MACKKDHKNLSDIMNSIPTDQGGIERHKCAACAYEKGLEAGLSLKKKLDINSVLNDLDDSQAGAQRHKNAHAAFALGYYKGVSQRIDDDNNK